MYLGQLIWPMFAIAWLFNIIERGSAAYSRIESLLGERSDIEEPAQPVALTSAFPLRAVALNYQLEQRTCCAMWISPCKPAACWVSSGAPARARVLCSSC